MNQEETLVDEKKVPTLRESAERYLAVRKRQVSPRAWLEEWQYLNVDILPKLGDLRLAELLDNTELIPELFRELGTRRPTPYCLACHTVLRQLIEASIFGAESPLTVAGGRAHEQRPRQIIPIATAQRLLTSSSVPLERRAEYAVMVGTGARIGEMHSACWGHRHTAAPIPYWVVGDGHSHYWRVSRRIPLAPFVLAALEVLHDSARLALCRDPRPEDLMLREIRRPVRPEVLRADLQAAGLPSDLHAFPFVLHDVRRSVNKWLEDAGVDGETRDAFLGHSIVAFGMETETISLERMAAAVAQLPFQFSAEGG
ncbi:site-specific integrase [Pendulispora brunnea]|uniref:Site-specific integrase n=1 Tax=Pendulispora brunnea TaxID=2905690 RepID=A0ABZ2KKH1_9BACT